MSGGEFRLRGVRRRNREGRAPNSEHAHPTCGRAERASGRARKVQGSVVIVLPSRAALDASVAASACGVGGREGGITHHAPQGLRARKLRSVWKPEGGRQQVGCYGKSKANVDEKSICRTFPDAVVAVGARQPVAPTPIRTCVWNGWGGAPVACRMSRRLRRGHGWRPTSLGA
jgi:hypothetical protein